jgi:diguanylate cyclase (GGDEF)-like protein
MSSEDALADVLGEFAGTLLTDFSIQHILDRLVERIVDILPITAAGVTLIADGVSPRHIAASAASALEFEQLQTELDEGPCLAAYRSGEAVAVTDLAQDDRFPRFGPAAAAAGLVGVFTFPLRHPKGRLGALDLYRDAPGGLGLKEMKVAQTLADVAASYLLNAWAHETARVTTDRLREVTLHDELTGLPNRLLLHDRLDQAARRARRSHRAAAILFADLDGFKLINDTYGHQVGDELLVAVAHRLVSLVRPGDTLARISGDEFVFLCEDLEVPEDVDALTQRIDSAFAQPFELASQAVAVSASVGVAYAGPGEDVSAEVVSRADAAMYEIKRQRGAHNDIIDIREAVDDQTDDQTDLNLERERMRSAPKPH